MASSCISSTLSGLHRTIAFAAMQIETGRGQTKNDMVFHLVGHSARFPNLHFSCHRYCHLFIHVSHSGPYSGPNIGSIGAQSGSKVAVAICNAWLAHANAGSGFAPHRTAPRRTELHVTARHNAARCGMTWHRIARSKALRSWEKTAQEEAKKHNEIEVLA